MQKSLSVSTMLFDDRRAAFIVAALSFTFIGVLQLYSKQILIGRPPFPVADAWQGWLLAWTVGVLLIITGALAITRQPVTIAAFILASFVVCYCVLPNLWLVLNGDTGAALTGFGKGASLASGLLVLTAAAPSQWQTRRSKIMTLVCNYALGFFLTASGIQHFLFAPFVMTLIPSWIPFGEFWTYATGVMLIVSGLCLVTGFKRRLALYTSSLMIFSWVILIHIPRAFFTVRNVNEWTALVFASVFASVLYIVVKRS